jgi:molybdenum cofactor guanylyltransferase
MTYPEPPLVLILAGGDGSRIGGAKPLRQLGGETLIERAIKKAVAWSDAVRISLRHPDQIGPVGLPVIKDAPDLQGPLAGLGAGLRAALDAGRETLLTLPCDMPFLPPDYAARLRDACPLHGACLAGSEGHEHPVCGLWPVSAALAALPAYAALGRHSLRGLAAAIGYSTVWWDGDPFFNINSAADLAEAERRLQNSSASTNAPSA